MKETSLKIHDNKIHRNSATGGVGECPIFYVGVDVLIKSSACRSLYGRRRSAVHPSRLNPGMMINNRHFKGYKTTTRKGEEKKRAVLRGQDRSIQHDCRGPAHGNHHQSRVEQQF